MSTSLDKNDQILLALLGAINSIKLYSDKHPQAILYVERVVTILSEIFQTEEELNIGVFNEIILVNQKPVIGIGKVSQSLTKALNQVDIDQIVFLKGLEEVEFAVFLKETFASGDLKSSDYPHILLGKIFIDKRGINKDKVESVLDLDSSQNFLLMLKNLDVNKPMNFNTVKSLSADMMEFFGYSVSPLKYLSDIKSEDEYTYVHTINVALLSMSFAEHIGISGPLLLDIIYAALMHDVGKILVPKEILNKTGPLTPKEFEIIKSHTLKGVMYLCNQQEMPRIAILVALEHHIKYNGGGYPTIDYGWKPHFVSQLISIADIYDALRSNRPYRPPLDHEQILGILRYDAGIGLNPVLVDIFIDMISK
ncbi:MAG: HD domain-containing protein [Gudongella sp.]|nr:HD domain-containing protein [Gudongella sp.]